MDEATVTIFLTQVDSEKFKEFQKHYEMFNLLLERKVFEQKAAAVTLHFDPQGVLRTIARSDFLYSATTQFDNTNQKVL